MFWSYQYSTAKKIKLSRDDNHTPLWKKLLSGAWPAALETRVSVALPMFELLAFNNKKFVCHVTLTTPAFRQFIKPSCRLCPCKHSYQIFSSKI